MNGKEHIDKEEDEALNQIFSKHQKKEGYKMFTEVNFDSNSVQKNKNEIKALKENKIIITFPRFCIDKNELNLGSGKGTEKTKEESQSNKNKKENYFQAITNETLSNQDLYCGYLDNFDKFWMHNQMSMYIYYINLLEDGNFDSKQLCCHACFNVISYESHQVHSQNSNCYTSREVVNSYLDYYEIYSVSDLSRLIKDGDSLSQKKILNLLTSEDTSDDLESQRQLISIKCSSCSNIVGVFDEENNINILLNCI